MHPTSRARPSRESAKFMRVLQTSLEVVCALRSRISSDRYGDSGNEAVSTARAAAREQILSTLEIHPVSAPEYRKILLDNEDDRAFLRAEDETGVPGLKARLVALAKAEQEARLRGIVEISERFRQGVVGELVRLDGLWREETRATDEAEKLERELESVIAPKRKERDLRVGRLSGVLGGHGSDAHSRAGSRSARGGGRRRCCLPVEPARRTLGNLASRSASGRSIPW